MRSGNRKPHGKTVHLPAGYWRTQLAKGKSRVPEAVLELFRENPFWTTTGIAQPLDIAFTNAGRAIERRQASSRLQATRNATACSAPGRCWRCWNGGECYATDMSAATMSKTRAPGTTGETKAVIKSIVGTGIGLATMLLMLAGLIIQQNANVNARIDDVNANVNARIDDVNARIDDLQEDIRELRALIIDAIKRPDPAD